MVRCQWCEKEERFVDEEPTDNGWYRLIGPGPDQEYDYCSSHCFLADQ